MCLQHGLSLYQNDEQEAGALSHSRGPNGEAVARLQAEDDGQGRPHAFRAALV
jgi:hypothetical protein